MFHVSCFKVSSMNASIRTYEYFVGFVTKRGAKIQKKMKIFVFAGVFLCLIACYFHKYVYLCSRNYK